MLQTKILFCCTFVFLAPLNFVLPELSGASFSAACVGENFTHAASDPDPVTLKLLVDMWDKNTENREGSEALFERQLSPSEQVLMAYTLNRMKHNRYRDARGPAGDLTQSFPSNLDGWVLRIWLDTVTNQYDSGLIGMQLMKRQMNKSPDLTDVEKEKYYLQLARIIGYLQGPVTKRTNQATLNDTIAKIVEGMTAEQLKKFNDQRTAILNEFDQYTTEASNLEKLEKQKSAAEAVVETEAIQAQNQTLDTRLQQIQPEKNRLEVEREQKASAVESQLSPLQQELIVAANVVQAIENRLQVAFNDRNFDQLLLAREEDPNSQAFILRRINRSNFRINAIQSELIAARATANTLGVQVRQLNAELARINQNYTGLVGQLNDEENQARRQQRKNTSRLGKIAKGSDATSSKVRRAEVAIESLKTYDPFPIELARQKFLDSFEAQN